MAAAPGSTSSNATTILVLGILSIFCGILGPFAWIMGNNALQTADPSQAQTINIGRICGIVGTILLILWVVGWIFWTVVIGAAMHHAAATMPTMPSNSPIGF